MEMTPIVDPKLIEETLRQASNDYYNGNPSMTDAEFDVLKDQLEKLEPNNPFLKEIGAPSNSVWPKVNHSRPMGSLLKVNNEEDFSKWAGKYTTRDLVWSEKLDGISLNAIYKNGSLFQGVTRGDGTTGDDITPNVKRMKNLPTIPVLSGVEVRGEVVFLKSVWKEQFPEDKNPRNSVAGACRRLDGFGCEHAMFFAYDVVGRDFSSKKEMFEWLEQMGFTTPAWGHVSPTDAQKVFDKYAADNCAFRMTLDYEIDGLVVEENDRVAFKRQGERDGRPKAARAYKFPALGAKTKLLDVVWQVGRTKIRPVGLLEPVELGGVTISRVDLCNRDEMFDRLGVKLGAEVTVFRMGDIIPKLQHSEGGYTDIKVPTNCPECSAPTDFKGPDLFCTGDDCPAKGHKRIMHYLRSLDVKGFGDKVILALCDAGMLKDPGDLYDLNPEDVGRLEGFGEKNALKAMRDLQRKSANIPLPKFIKSLGISLFGEGMTEKAVEGGYDTLEKLQEATVLKLVNVEGIGEEVALAAEKGLKEKKPLIDKLLVRVTIAAPAAEGEEGKFSGKTFVFTGFRSPQAEMKIKALGGRVTTSVSKKTTHLVVADLSSTSGKMRKAKELGAEIWTAEQLESML